MSARPYESQEEGWDGYREDQELELPGRPRRRFLNWGSAALLALAVGGIGFYVGVRVENGQVSNSSSSAGAFPGLGAAARSGASGAAGGRTGTGAAGARGFAGAFGGGNSSFGTVSSVNGKTIYLTQLATGNVVKVTLSSATKITKNVGAPKSAIRPGDTVVVSGVKGSGGKIAATSVSDSGASATGPGAGSGSSSSGSSGGSSSAVGSLFGGGGGK